MVEHTKCPNCQAAYKVVQVEAPSDPVEVTCLNCGAPLEGRKGRFLLKYFLVDRRRRSRPPAASTSPNILRSRTWKNPLRRKARSSGTGL